MVVSCFFTFSGTPPGTFRWVPATYDTPETEMSQSFLDYRYVRKDMRVVLKNCTSSSPKVIRVRYSID